MFEYPNVKFARSWRFSLFLQLCVSFFELIVSERLRR